MYNSVGRFESCTLIQRKQRNKNNINADIFSATMTSNEETASSFIVFRDISQLLTKIFDFILHTYKIP